MVYPVFDPEKSSKKEITVEAGKANVMSILIPILPMIILALPFYFFWKGNYGKSFGNITYGTKTAIILGSIIFGLIIHELIHGLTWSVFTTKGLKSIKFGVIWKILTPYCHCLEPLKVWQYMLGSIMPFFMMGVLPSLAAYLTGNLFLLIYGMIFTLAAGGDLLLIWMLRKENRTDRVMDHPGKMGCIIYKK
jgi:hypothetical protein